MDNKEFNKLYEGCGKNFFVGMGNKVGVVEFRCGDWTTMPTPENWDKMLWCPLCAEKMIAILLQRIKNEVRNDG